MASLEDRVLTLELKQTNHEMQCSQRWGMLIKLIGWGGGLSLTLLIAVAGWGLNRVYDAQQHQTAAIEQILAGKH